MNIYKNILVDKGMVHLKTDSEFLHGYTLGVLKGLSIKPLFSNHDIYKREGSPKEVTILN